MNGGWDCRHFFFFFLLSPHALIDDWLLEFTTYKAHEIKDSTFKEDKHICVSLCKLCSTVFFTVVAALCDFVPAEGWGLPRVPSLCSRSTLAEDHRAPRVHTVEPKHHESHETPPYCIHHLCFWVLWHIWHAIKTVPPHHHHHTHTLHRDDDSL